MKKVNCYFAVSRVCNLRCKYCYVPEYNKASQSDYDVRALAAAERFADKVRREKLPIGHISLHGAEPTILSPETLGNIITTFAELTGQTVRMQSNGTLLTPDYLDRLLKVIRDPRLFFVGVSVDGSANIHNPQRNKTWDLVFRNLFELKERGFGVGLLAVITSLTVKHLKDFGFWMEYMHRIVDSLTFKLGEHGFGLTEEEKGIFARWLCDNGAIKNLQAFMPDLCIQDGNDCGFFEFDIDGNTYSCNKHFNEEGIFASWFDEPFEAILAKRDGLYREVEISPGCETCSLQNICHSGCPVSRDNGKSVDCRVRKVVYSQLQKEGIDPENFFAVDSLATDDALLRSAFPVFFAQAGEERSDELLSQFKKAARLTGKYGDYVGVFFQFLQAQPSEGRGHAFLLELADYEYSRLRLNAQDSRPSEVYTGSDSADLPLADARLRFVPGLVLKQYHYPVHRLTEDHNAPTPEDTSLLLFRNQHTQETEQFSLTPEAFRFVDFFLKNPETAFGEGVQQLVATCPDIPQGDTADDAVAFLKNLCDRSVVVALVGTGLPLS